MRYTARIARSVKCPRIVSFPVAVVATAQNAESCVKSSSKQSSKDIYDNGIGHLTHARSLKSLISSFEQFEESNVIRSPKPNAFLSAGSHNLNFLTSEFPMIIPIMTFPQTTTVGKMLRTLCAEHESHPSDLRVSLPSEPP